MKVFNLRCTHGHGFEGWFGSDQELVSQRERGLLTCPVCGDAQVQKLPSAPRLNLRSATVGGTAMASDQSGLPAAAMAVTAAPEQLAQIRLLEAMRLLVSRSEDVGERFPEQALAMHHGEMEPRAIRGQATAEQALELLDEGVALLPLPALKETLH